MNDKINIRSLQTELFTEGRIVEGYALRFNEISGLQFEPFKRVLFKEVIRSGAITQEEIDAQDVFAYYNHDKTKVLGRTSAGTLQLEVRDEGLYYMLDVPETETGNELLEHIRRGEMNGTSFGFVMTMDLDKDAWTKTEEKLGDTPVYFHEIRKLPRILEISPCFTPAFPTTSVFSRSTEDFFTQIENIEETNMQEEEMLRSKNEEEEKKEEQQSTSEEEKKDEKVEQESSEDTSEKETEDTSEETKDDASEDTEDKEEETEDKDEQKRSINNEKINKHSNMKQTFNLFRALIDKLDGRELNAVDARINELGQEQLRSAGLVASNKNSIAIPDFRELTRDATDWTNPVLVTGENGEKDDIVQTDLMDILKPLEDKLPLREAGVAYMTGLKNNIQWPKGDGIVVSWQKEVGNNNTSAAFTSIKLTPHRITAYVDVSRQALIQSSFSMQSYLLDELTTKLAYALEKKILSADAADDTIDAPAGIFADGAHVSPDQISTFEGITKLEAQLDGYDTFGNVKYIASPAAKAFIRNMVRGGDHTQNVFENNEIDGTPVVVSRLVKDYDENFLALGDWSKLLIAQWSNTEFTIDDISHMYNGFVRISINAFFDYAVLEDNAIIKTSVSDK